MAIREQALKSRSQLKKKKKKDDRQLCLCLWIDSPVKESMKYALGQE